MRISFERNVHCPKILGQQHKISLVLETKKKPCPAIFQHEIDYQSFQNATTLIFLAHFLKSKSLKIIKVVTNIFIISDAIAWFLESAAIPRCHEEDEDAATDYHLHPFLEDSISLGKSEKAFTRFDGACTVL